MQFLLGAILAALIALAAYRARALTVSGAVSAWAIGAVIFGVGGWGWGAALVAFFATSSGLSRWRRRVKARMGFDKGGRRDAGQVWANGGAAAACALLALLRPVRPGAPAVPGGAGGGQRRHLGDGGRGGVGWDAA